MPVVSQAQRRFMFATAEGKTDVPVSVGKDFISASKGLKDLPEHVSHGTSAGTGTIPPHFRKVGAGNNPLKR